MEAASVASLDLKRPFTLCPSRESAQLLSEQAQAGVLDGERHEAQSLPLPQQGAGQLSDMILHLSAQLSCQLTVARINQAWPTSELPS